MKEMCRNFLCNTNRCPKVSSNTPCAAAAQATNSFALTPDAGMGDCSACVRERIGLAQAYVPSQPFEAPKDQEQSLVCGTAFSDLSMPYCSGWNLYRFRREA